jgi:hypothetical protein
MPPVKTDTMSEPSSANLPAVPERAPQGLPPVPTAVPKSFPAKIAKAILSVTREIGHIAKDGKNQFQNYKYAKWEDVVDKLSPLLAQHGLVIVQSEQSRSLLEENDKGSTLAIVYEFTLINEDGDMWPPVTWTSIARLRDQKGITDDKAAAKCHTQAEKYFCIKQFKIRTFEDLDSDKDCGIGMKTLPKKDARGIFAKLQGEIDIIAPIAAFKAWMQDNVERFAVLPEDWQDILRLKCQERLAELRQHENKNEVVWEEDGEYPVNGTLTEEAHAWAAFAA